MDGFNWGAYESWCNQKEWDNEPHLEECSCDECEDGRKDD